MAALFFIVFSLSLIGLSHALERRRPAVRHGAGDMRLNLLAFIMRQGSHAAAMMLLGGVTVSVVNTLGGGWIKPPESGAGLLWSFLCYTVVIELVGYFTHRLQHYVPVLWAMHSLHHSDLHFNVSTAVRHHWAEPFIGVLCVYPIVGLLIKAPALVVVMYALLSSAWVCVIHLNVRLDLGRWTVVLSSPDFHRLHHSSLQKHYNCNFSNVLPIFDWMFGTYRSPTPDELPPTGLANGARPKDAFEVLVWPIHASLRSGSLRDAERQVRDA